VFEGSAAFSDHVSHGEFDIAGLGFCGRRFVHNSLIIISFINVTGCGGMGVTLLNFVSRKDAKEQRRKGRKEERRKFLPSFLIMRQLSGFLV
jgi:hypothetical protein